MKFPRIDSPCPLSPEEQRRIDGHCDRCDRHVHRLDGLDEAGRRALLAAQRGPVCVAYRVPRRGATVSGIAIAATLVTASAFAAPQQAPAPAQSPVQTAPLVPVDDALDMVMVGGIQSAESAEWEEASELDRITMTGGVDDPAAATWVDTSELPEIPVEVETPTASPSRAR